MRIKLIILLAAVVISTPVVRAQAPVAAAPQPTVAAQAQASNSAVLQALQQAKAANDAILAKQAATLQQLLEMEKAAEQMRVLTSRS
jgi:hypothetical protein